MDDKSLLREESIYDEMKNKEEANIAVGWELSR